MNGKEAPKKPAPKDWHTADIKAALEKAGWTLRKLSLHHNYKQATTLAEALHRPNFPKAERLIAEAIGVSPETIWPSRYEQRAKRQKRTLSKSTSEADNGTPESRKAA